MAKIAILGYGTVGSGVFEVLSMNADSVAENAGEPVEIKYVLDLRDFPGDPAEKKIVHDVEVILNDPEVSVVVETMGGNEPAHTFVKRALEAGKSVCTSNKNLVEAYGSELLKIAKEKKVRFLFEAAVGGGIPIIRPIKDALTADKVDFITGILNGTCNYILTKMSVEGMEFEDALKQAQDNGFAERDPAADIEGHDSCRKIAILASLVTGKNVDFEDITTIGISNISASDFAYAGKLGMKVKLLSSASYRDGKLKAITAPFLVSGDNRLFNVDDVINGVWIHGNAVGDLVFQGAGAGKLPTASAVSSDVVDAVKNKDTVYKLLWSDDKISPEDAGEYMFRYFIRVNEADKDKAEEVFGNVKYIEADGISGEAAFITGVMTENEYNEKSGGVDIINMIRITPDTNID